ncbi:MAG: tetratricopeptide repeat protein [Solirubrobacterales bacterium]
MGLGRTRTDDAVSLLVGGVLAAVLGGWAWSKGAFFETGLFPGVIVLMALAGVLLVYGRWHAQMSRPAGIALGALCGLALWTLLSATWSPAPDVAVADALRVAAYAVAFGLGIWFCHLLGPRMALAPLPLAGAGAAVAVFTVVALLTGSDTAAYLAGDGTLQFPLGYHNANAAFFLLAFWAAVTLAAGRTLAAPLRVGALAAATVCLELAIMGQSRASVGAIALAAMVWVVAAQDRARAVLAMAAAAAPAVIALPALLAVLGDGGGNGPETLPLLRDAGRMIVVSMLLSGGVGLALIAADARLPDGQAFRRRANRAVTVGAAGLALIAAVVFVAAVGSPVTFVGERIDEFRTSEPAVEAEGSRFTAGLASGRQDLWRVALETGGEHPLLGEGAGGFKFAYLVGREGNEQPQDPHSVEMLVWSELGLPGLLLFGAAVAGALLAGWRSRPLGPAAGVVAAGGLAVGTQWFTHASVDWFWSYPVVTAAAFLALGTATAPALLALQPGGRRVWRAAGVAAVSAAALAALPLWTSARLLDTGQQTWGQDLEGAYADLDRSADLNPWNPRPDESEGLIAQGLEDEVRSLLAFDEAVARQPRSWSARFFRARALQRLNRLEEARSELIEARRLNPRSELLRDVLAEVSDSIEAAQ